jgi:hypothetical protein
MPLTVPIPTIRFSSWFNSELADPVGTRHLVSGAFAYDKELGIGCPNAMSFANLKLSLANDDPFVGSDVKVVNVCVPNFGTLQASGLSAVYNMRLWLPSGSGTAIGITGASLQFATSGVWVPNLSFPSGFGQTLLTTLPTQFNLRRIDGRSELISFNDQNVSEWIYMRLFLDRDFPVGTYGICGSGLLRPRLTFDFY